ncbi:MAG: C45 family autoproteolytic acyltransferase/hydrolase [Promethearchaeota archaeon]
MNSSIPDQSNFDHFRFLRVKGSNYQIGFQTGKKFRNQIKNVVENSLRIQNLLKFDRKHPEKALTSEQLIQANFPQYLEEIRGIAEGSAIDYHTILLINLFHLYEHEDCSTVIFKSDSEILIAHNEDHNQIMCENSYYLEIHLPNDVVIFTHTYPGSIPGYSHGMNSHGIVITCNYVPDPIEDIGIPRTILGRWMLESNSIEQAIERSHGFTPRSGGVSYNIGSVNEQRVVNVEITGRDWALTEIEDKFFHPNHYISPKFSQIPVPDSKYSTTKKRLKRSKELLPIIEKSSQGALKILWDPDIFILPHAIPKKGIHFTFNTSVFHLKNHQIFTEIYSNQRNSEICDKYKMVELKKG